MKSPKIFQLTLKYLMKLFYNSFLLAAYHIVLLFLQNPNGFVFL